MKIKLLIAAMMIHFAVLAQNNYAAKYADIINTISLKKHLSIIASDSMEGRETGTRGQLMAAAYIQEQFIKAGLEAPARLNGYQQFYEVKIDTGIIKASNVLAIIEGTDKKDEYVFLTAHYDHLGIRRGKIYNGADDDGSGTVAVIQMAEAFAKAKKEGHGPRRTIVFMTVSGEEKGLWGSEYYSNNPIYPLDKTSVDLNTDMIGRIDTERKKADTMNYVYVVGHNKISSELPVINEAANNNNTKLVLDYKFDDPNDPERIYYRSDHYNFAVKGIPVLFFYDGMLLADYHKPTDDVEKINWPLYEKRARMIFFTAWEMANRDNMLIRDIPLN
jgi:Zn-dependent M28 family amino/carboxypeptidase